MDSAVPKEATVSGPEKGLLYKCPIGGFASLRAGTCPKCRESLTLVVVVGDLDRHSGDDGVENTPRARILRQDGPDFT